MWFPAVVILWALWFDQLRGLTWLRGIGLALSGVTAVTAVIASPEFLPESVDLVRPRTELSVELRDQVQLCADATVNNGIKNSEALTELAPSMTWEEVCRAHSFVGLN
jgi:hypothetical protein